MVIWFFLALPFMIYHGFTKGYNWYEWLSILLLTMYLLPQGFGFFKKVSSNKGAYLYGEYLKRIRNCPSNEFNQLGKTIYEELSKDTCKDGTCKEHKFLTREQVHNIWACYRQKKKGNGIDKKYEPDMDSLKDRLFKQFTSILPKIDMKGIHKSKK